MIKKTFILKTKALWNSHNQNAWVFDWQSSCYV